MEKADAMGATDRASPHKSDDVYCRNPLAILRVNIILVTLGAATGESPASEASATGESLPCGASSARASEPREGDSYGTRAERMYSFSIGKRSKY